MVPWKITDSSLFRRIQLKDITSTSPPIFSLASGLFVRDDGRKLYILGFTFTGSVSGGRLFEYNMNTAWDVSTLVYTGGSKCLDFGCDGEVNPNMQGQTGLFFKPDGTRVFIATLGRLGASTIFQYNLSSPWNVSTASLFPAVSLNVVAQTGTFGAGGLSFKPDGTKMYLTQSSGGEQIIEYNLSTPWALNTASPTGNTFQYDTVRTFPPGNPGFTGLSNVIYTWFRADGLRAFVGGTNRMRTLNMTVPFDLSTMSQDNNDVLNTIGINTVPQIFFFKPDGLRWFLLGGGGTGGTLNDMEIPIGTRKTKTFGIGAKIGPKTLTETFRLDAFIQPIVQELKESLIETWDGYPLGSIFDKRDNANNNMRFDGQSAGPRGWTVMKTLQHTSQGPRADGPPAFTSGPVWEVVDDTILGSRALKMQMDATMTQTGLLFGAELGQTMRMENIPNKFRFLSIKARLEDFNSTTRVGFGIRFNAKNGEGRNGGTVAIRRIWLNGSGANTSIDDLVNFGQGSYDFNTNVDLSLGNNDILDLENFDIRSLFGGDYYSWTLILYSTAFSSGTAAPVHKCDVRWGKISMSDIPSSDKIAFSLDAIIKEPEKHEFSFNAKLVDWHDDLGAFIVDWTSTTGQIRTPDLDEPGIHGTNGVSYHDLPKAAITKTTSPGSTKIGITALPAVNRFDNNFTFTFRLWNHQKLGNFATPVWMALSETVDGVLTGTVQNKIYARQTALNFREFVMFIVATDDAGNSISGSGRLHYPPVSDVWCRVEVRQNTAKLIIARDPTFTDQMISQRDGENEAVPDIIDISSFNPTPTHPTGTGKFNNLSFVQTTAGGGGSDRRELYPSNITNMTVERIAPVVFSIDAIIKAPVTARGKIDAILLPKAILECQATGLFHKDNFTTGQEGWDNNVPSASNGTGSIQIDNAFSPGSLNFRFLLPTDFGIRRAWHALDKPGKIDEDFVWEFKHRHYRPGGSAFNQFNGESQVSLKETGTNHIVGFNGVVGARAPVFGFSDGTTNTQFSIPDTGGVSDETMVRYRTDSINYREDPAPGSVGGLAHGPNDIVLEVFDKGGINSVHSKSFKITLQDNGNTGFFFFPRITKTGNKIKLEMFVNKERTELATVGNGLIFDGFNEPTAVVEVDVTGFDFSQPLGFIYFGNHGRAVPTGGSAFARQVSEQFDEILLLGNTNLPPNTCNELAIDAVLTPPPVFLTKIKEFTIEGSIQKTFGRGMTANAILFGRSGESGGIPPVIPEVDSLIKRLGENGTEGAGLKSFGIDAFITDDGIKFTCVDAFLPNPGLVEDYFTNGLIQSTGDNGSNGGDDIDQDEDDNIITIPIGTLVGQRLTLATTPLRIITLKFTLHRDGLSGGATGTLTGKIYRNSVTGNAISGGDLIATSTNFVSVSSLTTSVTGTQVSFSFTGLEETSPNNNIFLGFDVSGSNEQLFLHTESTGTAISGGDVTVESPSGFWGGNLGVDATFEMIVNPVVKNRGFAIMNTLLLKEQDTDFEINAIIVRRDAFDINAIIEIPVPKEKINEFTIDADIFDPFATSSFESVVGP